MRAIWLVVLTACSLNVDYTGTYYQCNPDGTCPPDYECIHDVCVPSDPVPPACSKDVSAGGMHACAVRNDGTVWCWGRNDFGQLGDGSAIDSDVPVQVANLVNITNVAAGELHTCALDDLGQIWCWGANGLGQLGDGTTSDSRIAVQVGGVTGVSQLSVGSSHTCVLRGDSGVACWGDNENGQIGDGSMSVRNTPTMTMVSGARAINAGYDITCAAMTDGTAQCWGENDDGELGVGDTMPHAQPTVVRNVANVETIAAGDNFTCFVTKDGTVFCSGLNDQGQLGTGDLTSATAPQHTPIPVRAVSIDAGSSHACVRDEVDGTWCWGNGADGRLFDETYNRRTYAVRGVLDKVQTVSAGYEHTCALDKAGAIRCAGFNRRGQLGDGRPITTGGPVLVDGIEDAVMLVAGARHMCAAQANGNVLCWGENDDGEAGNGSYQTYQTVPHIVYGVASPTQMVAGAEHTCILMEGGVTACWGYNGTGRLGDGTQTSSAQPREMVGVGGPASRVAAGDEASFALLGNGARCWGEDFGVMPTTISNITDIAAGTAHVCTLEPDKTVSCFGENYRYQLGDGTQTARTEPGVTAMGVTNAVEIKARGEQTCARIGDGTVKCWGLNESGRLGVGNTSYVVQTPTVVQGLSNVMKFAMGYDASCAIKADGTLWCWGANYFGQVGDGSYQTRPAPVQILELSGVKDVASGGAHTCAIDSQGRVVCWGLGSSGQLGNGIREVVSPVGVRMTCPE